VCVRVCVCDREAELDELDAKLDDVEAALAPFLRVPLKSAASQLSGAEQAKLHATHAYAIYSLLFS
jgi:hypothetical protein